MLRNAKRWALAATLATLMQVTLVCDGPDMDDVEEFFEDLDIEVHYDDHGHHHDDCWYGCEDDFFFDFDWWW